MSGIVYFGIEQMGLNALQALHETEKEICCVYTLVEEKRDSIIAYRSFDEFCLTHAIPLHKIDTANDPNIIREIVSFHPDIIYVVGWSELICEEITSIPIQGCIGFHGALLPKHRGRAPIPWSIIFGLRRSGMSMFFLTPGVDNGLLIDQDSYPIEPTDYASDVYMKSCRSICRLIQKNHAQIVARAITPCKQDQRLADTWPKRLPQDGIMDWNKSCHHLFDWIRALSRPFPGAFTFFENRKLYVWRSQIADPSAKNRPGEILSCNPEYGLEVACGEGSLNLTLLQFEGKAEMTPMETRDFFSSRISAMMEF